MKIVSFNIRCVGDPNGNSVKERAERLKTVLDKYDAELIGFRNQHRNGMNLLKGITVKSTRCLTVTVIPIIWNQHRSYGIKNAFPV